MATIGCLRAACVNAASRERQRYYVLVHDPHLYAQHDIHVICLTRKKKTNITLVIKGFTLLFREVMTVCFVKGFYHLELVEDGMGVGAEGRWVGGC